MAAMTRPLILPMLAAACLAFAVSPVPVRAGSAADVAWAVTLGAPDRPVLGGAYAQEGPEADALHAVAARISVPPGFSVRLFARLPQARHMALGPRSQRLFVGTRGDRVFAVGDRNRDSRADFVRQFAPGLSLTFANGVCFAPDGHLYIAELNRLLIVSGTDAAGEGVADEGLADRGMDDEGMEVRIGVVKAPLVPPREASPGHGMRTCAVGADEKIYITQGQPHNVAPREKLALYDQAGVGGIVRMNRWDGTDWEVYARGIRNSVGMAFNPANGELWFTDNQVDGMGDLIPPGEINRSTGPGQHFGFPWYGGGATRTDEYRHDMLPPGLVFPAVQTDAHATDLGMTFYSGDSFPAKYRGGFFSAQHGSWDRSDPIGARVLFTAVKTDGSPGATEVFAEGWLDPATGDYRGRPVDVIEYWDGSLLVSDDHAGAIYRIAYDGE